MANAVNSRGQVVGAATNTTPDNFSLLGTTETHAFLWQHGLLSELHNTLGGNNSAALAINNAGEAVGWVSLPGDKNIPASIWKNHTMTDLGTLAGDPCSVRSPLTQQRRS
jgi:probable HAF family extracellular repeat protein